MMNVKEAIRNNLMVELDKCLSSLIRYDVDSLMPLFYVLCAHHLTKGQATRNSFISNVRHTVDTISKGELKSLQDLFAKVFNSIHNTEVKNLVEPIQTNNIKLSKYLNQTLTRQIKSILGLTNQNISNPSNVAELIYKIRCCIVHSKESEIHFTPNNISEYKDLIPVMRVLIKVIQNSIVETINNSGKKDLEFQSESMLLY